MNDAIVTAHDDGYRSNQTEEMLLELLAAPHVNAIQRSKAARRLVEMHDDADMRAAIRSVALATADPWLRLQFERWADGDLGVGPARAGKR